jgi:hypothetical protein
LDTLWLWLPSDDGVAIRESLIKAYMLGLRDSGICISYDEVRDNFIVSAAIRAAGAIPSMLRFLCDDDISYYWTRKTGRPVHSCASQWFEAVHHLIHETSAMNFKGILR